MEKLKRPPKPAPKIKQLSQEKQILRQRIRDADKKRTSTPVKKRLPPKKYLRPHPGKQTEFLACNAKVVFYGGEAGGGKSTCLLFEALRNSWNALANCVIFRRTTKQITQAGGLWDKSQFYKQLGFRSNSVHLEWKNDIGYTIQFNHIEHEKNIYNYDGAEITTLMFDELISFSEESFFYLLSRNRSTSDSEPCVRATTNPDPDSWVRKFIDWYIGEDGHVSDERSGVIRWFIRHNDAIQWFSSYEDGKLYTITHDLEMEPTSFTFIKASLEDNPTLIENDPHYKSNLLSLGRYESERLLGNWHVTYQVGDFYNRADFEIIDADDVPTSRRTIRFWDRAATKKKPGNDPDATTSIKLSRCNRGIFYIEHWSGLLFETPDIVEDNIVNYASQDGTDCTIGFSIDPGQAGKFENAYYIKLLAKYELYSIVETLNKESRAKPSASQTRHNNVKIVRSDWNEELLAHLEKFPKGRYKDPIDSFSGAFSFLVDNQCDDITTMIDEQISKTEAEIINKVERW